MEALDNKTARPSQPPLGGLFDRLFGEVKVLISEEITLARHEMSQKFSLLAGDMALVGIGLVLAHGGFLVLLAALVAGLVHVGLDLWMAALAVAIGAVAIGGGLAMTGLKAARRVRLVPQQTLETLKEDVQWAKQVIR